MRGLHLGPGTPPGTNRRIVTAAREAGLVLCPAGISSSTQAVLVAPPLTIDRADIDVFEHRFETALRNLRAAG